MLEIFPEAKNIIKEKIIELNDLRNLQIKYVRKKLKMVKNSDTDDFSKWFCREWIKIDSGRKLVETEDQIGRLKRIISSKKYTNIKNWVSEEEIQQALKNPIENFITKPIKKSGKNFISLCPLHNEKTPSFYIYSETNSCWCFGCNQGGNVINFIKLLKDYSFQDAVKYLNN